MATKSERNFRTVLRDLAESSSLHGIPKIVSSKQKPVKVLWFMLVLATCIVFGLQLYNLFSAYYSWPVQTTVSLKFSPLRYPAVTFCNMNPVKRSQLSKFENLYNVINPKKVRETEARKKRSASSTTENTTAGSNSKKTSTSSEGSASGTNTNSGTSSSSQGSNSGTTSSKGSNSGTTSSQGSNSGTSSSQGSNSGTTSSQGSNSGTTSSQGSNSGTSSSQGSNSGTTSSHGSTTTPQGSNSGTTTDTDSGSWYVLGNGSSDGTYYYYDYWGSGYEGSASSSTDYSTFFNSSTSFFWESGFGDSASTGLFGYVQDQLFLPKDQWEERIRQFNELYKMEPLHSREDMGHSADDMVISASFAGRLQNASTFDRIMTTKYGNCYTMTSPSYIALRSGPSYGIKLTLNLEIDEYIQNFASGYGIRIVFHEPGTLPLPTEEGMTLSPGFETHIGLQMVSVERQGPPYGHCSDGAEFFQKYKIRYSITACFLLCRVQRTIEYCGCMPPDSPDLNYGTETTRICQGINDTACQFVVDLLFEDKNIVKSCGCVSPCRNAPTFRATVHFSTNSREVVYQKTISGRHWPNDDYLKNVLMGDSCGKSVGSLAQACNDREQDVLDVNKYRYNFLQVMIYFEDLNYESITQEPLYEGVRFLSDIGGAMGLFMGASVLSFVEILQLIVEMVMFVYRRNFPDKKVQSISVAEKRQPAF